MAKRALVPSVVSSSRELIKQLQSSTTPKVAIITNNRVCFSNAHLHTQGDAAANEEVKVSEVVESIGEVGKGTVDTAWDAAKKSAETVIETITAEADTNVVDTVEYRSSEDLKGQLGDGCDSKIEF